MNSWLERYRGIIIGILSAATLIGGAMVYSRQPDPPPLEIVTLPTETPTQSLTTPLPPTATSTPRPLRVYITGEVNAPDVYLLPIGSIIKDAIAAAGGTTTEADLKVINLARELQDQQQITIPAKSEKRPTPEIIEGGVKSSSSQQNPNASLNKTIPADAKININVASLEELIQLPGIGPAIGQRIIDYRTAQGFFTTIESIMDVKGIGPATFDKIKADITVDE